VVITQGDYVITPVKSNHFDMQRVPKGRRVAMTIDGQVRTLCTIGELAAVVHRSSHTLRGWERQGLIPPPPLVIQDGDVCTRRRLYPVELLAVMRGVAIQEGFGRRRPSGSFLQQQQQIWDAWREVMESLTDEYLGITETAEQ
jgi:hypothetical protein